MHGIGQEDVERPTLALRLLLAAFDQATKFDRLALELGEYLQTVVVITHILLVDDKHRQQEVE